MGIPVFFLMIIFTLEGTTAYILRNSLTNAAYEGARRGMVPGATAEDAADVCQRLLAASRITNASVTVSPATITEATEQITVTVTARVNDNLFGIGWIMRRVTVTSSTSLTREGFLSSRVTAVDEPAAGMPDRRGRRRTRL